MSKHGAQSTTTAEAVTPTDEEAREALRQRLAEDLEAFLNSGGAIQSIPAGVRADPPKRPEPKYGGGSI